MRGPYFWGTPHRNPPNPHFFPIFQHPPPSLPPSSQSPHFGGGRQEGTHFLGEEEGEGVESQPHMSHNPTCGTGGEEGRRREFPLPSHIFPFFRCFNPNLGWYFPFRTTFFLFLGRFTSKLEQDISVCILFSHHLCFLTQNWGSVPPTTTFK